MIIYIRGDREQFNTIRWFISIHIDECRYSTINDYHKRGEIKEISPSGTKDKNRKKKG